MKDKTKKIVTLVGVGLASIMLLGKKTDDDDGFVEAKKPTEIVRTITGETYSPTYNITFPTPTSPESFFKTTPYNGGGYGGYGGRDLPGSSEYMTGQSTIYPTKTSNGIWDFVQSMKTARETFASKKDVALAPEQATMTGTLSRDIFVEEWGTPAVHETAIIPGDPIIILDKK